MRREMMKFMCIKANSNRQKDFGVKKVDFDQISERKALLTSQCAISGGFGVNVWFNSE
jgi:hypothetical protein